MVETNDQLVIAVQSSLNRDFDASHVANFIKPIYIKVLIA
jgi:hypothetical protein